MKYYLAKWTLHHYGDDEGRDDNDITMVVVAPNSVAAWHVLSKVYLTTAFTEGACSCAQWDPWHDLDKLSFFDSRSWVRSFREIPSEHYDVLRHYFTSHSFVYDEMKKYGNYSEIYSESYISSPDLTAEKRNEDTLFVELSQHADKSSICSIRLLESMNKGFEIEVLLEFGMQSGYKYNCKIHCSVNSKLAQTWLKDGIDLLESDIKSVLSIGARPSQDFTDDRLEIRDFLDAVGSSAFKKFAIKSFKD